MRVLFLLVLLVGCAAQEAEEPVVVSPLKSPFAVDIFAKGVLEATQAIELNVPSELQEPQFISWVIEDNAEVKKGELVARLDNYRFLNNEAREKLQIIQTRMQQKAKEANLRGEQIDITAELELVQKELSFAQTYALDDLRVYSRNEIIEKLQNVDFLAARSTYQNWRKDQQVEKASAEMELLNLQLTQNKTRLAATQNSLNNLEIRAPKDGLVILNRDWSGEKPKVGDMQWPGEAIATIPDLSEFKARLFVHESEAINLTEKLPVAIRLNRPDLLELKGTVVSVDKVAKIRQRNVPTKFIELIVSIEKPQEIELKAGMTVDATIHAIEKPEILSLPLQSLLRENEQDFVMKWSKNSWVKTPIKVGARSFARFEILEGVSESDTVLLTPTLQEHAG